MVPFRDWFSVHSQLEFCVTSAGEVVQPVALQGAYSVLATYADGIPDVLGEGWSV
jgi:hypothetical protein